MAYRYDYCSSDGVCRYSINSDAILTLKNVILKNRQANEYPICKVYGEGTNLLCIYEYKKPYWSQTTKSPEGEVTKTYTQNLKNLKG